MFHNLFNDIVHVKTTPCLCFFLGRYGTLVLGDIFIFHSIADKSEDLCRSVASNSGSGFIGVGNPVATVHFGLPSYHFPPSCTTTPELGCRAEKSQSRVLLQLETYVRDW